MPCLESVDNKGFSAFQKNPGYFVTFVKQCHTAGAARLWITCGYLCDNTVTFTNVRIGSVCRYSSEAQCQTPMLGLCQERKRKVRWSQWLHAKQTQSPSRLPTTQRLSKMLSTPPTAQVASLGMTPGSAPTRVSVRPLW